MNFNELLKRLPGIQKQPAVVSDQGKAFTNVPAQTEGFVTPAFDIFDWPDDATVLLIEAAGAVGKTSAAEAIAEQLRWPLVRAEHARVGSYTLSGLVQDALGFDGTYIQSIASGKAGVVVDSLDEALFRVGVENFLAFIENIQSIAGRGWQQSPRKPSVILMSRTEASEFVQLSFADKNIPLARARLAFFDRPSAEKFIVSYMRKRFNETKEPQYNIHQGYTAPFARLRDLRLTQMMQVISRNPAATLNADWATTEEFLGYAPVLIALAESLAVANPSAEYSVLSKVSVTTERELLKDIVNRILLREHLKFADQIRDSLHAALPASSDSVIDSNTLYRPIEQVIRVLSYVDNNSLVDPPPSSLPRPVRETYELAANRFMTNHPFIRGRDFTSTVFEDYARAASVVSLEAATALGSDPVDHLQEPGPFFVSFLRDFLPVDASIPETCVEPAIRSWAQLHEVSKRPTESLLQLAEGSSWLYLGAATRPGEQIPSEEHSLEFRISDLSGAFHYKRNLRDITIIATGGIILGRPVEPLTIGPNALIAADEIDIQSEALTIGWRAKGMGVALSASTLSANRLTQLDGELASLILFCEMVPPRLQPYRKTLSSELMPIPFSDYVDLRAILTSFRSTVHMGLSTSRVRMDNQIIKNNARRERILQALVEQQIVTSNAEWYRLDSAELSRAGFSLNDIKAGEPSKEVLNFLSSCR